MQRQLHPDNLPAKSKSIFRFPTRIEQFLISRTWPDYERGLFRYVSFTAIIRWLGREKWMPGSVRERFVNHLCEVEYLYS